MKSFAETLIDDLKRNVKRELAFQTAKLTPSGKREFEFKIDIAITRKADQILEEMVELCEQDDERNKAASKNKIFCGSPEMRVQQARAFIKLTIAGERYALGHNRIAPLKAIESIALEFQHARESNASAQARGTASEGLEANIKMIIESARILASVEQGAKEQRGYVAAEVAGVQVAAFRLGTQMMLLEREFFKGISERSRRDADTLGMIKQRLRDGHRRVYGDPAENKRLVASEYEKARNARPNAKEAVIDETVKKATGMSIRSVQRLKPKRAPRAK